MQGIQQSNHSVGICTEGDSLTCAFLTSEKDAPHIERLVYHDWNRSDTDVKPLYIDDDTPFSKIEDKWLIVSGIKAEDTLVRNLELKLKREKDIAATLPFQAEPHIPYSVEDALLAFQPLQISSKGSLISLFATQKSTVQDHLELWGRYEIEPEIISTYPTALARFGHHFQKEALAPWPLIVIYSGFEETICCLTQEGKLLASHAFALGKESIQQENYSQGLAKIFYAITKQCKVEEVVEILFTGPGANDPQATKHLSQALQTQLSLPQGRYGSTIEDLNSYAISIGLALEGLHITPNPTNFRQGPFSFPHPWKRYKKPLLSYLLLSLLLSLAIYFTTQTWTSYSLRKLQSSYSQLLTTLKKGYTQNERDFLIKKLKLPENQEVDSPSILSLDQDDIEERLTFQETEIGSIPDVFPLMPNVPRVSDVLAWLATHPQLKELTIETFHYSLIKRPDQKKKNEKYTVKIDLEFSTPIPKLAREFHDTLIAPNEMVDPKGEVKWSSSRDRYKTTFFLKNKAISSR